MKLWMSGEVDVDVGDDEHVARNAIEPLVNDALNGVSFVETAERWSLILIILSDTFLSGFPEVVKRSSKGKVLEFRLQVAHAEFKQASSEKQVAMIFDALSRSIELMPKLKISPESQEKFRTALATARSSFLPK